MNNSSNHRGRGDDDTIKELSFDDDNNPPPKAGDPRVTPGQPDPEISARRVREAGLTGAETHRDITDDDLSPETLFDEEYDTTLPADKSTRVVDAAEIGGGSGLDEAELARAEHPDDEIPAADDR